MGKTLGLTATVAPGNATNKNVTWSSSNSSIATVDENGVATGISAGWAVITATTEDGSKKASCVVKVKELVKVTGVSLNKNSVSLRIGQITTLTATVLPNNASDKAVTWNQSNTKVATVDCNGWIIAKGKGTSIITVTTTDGKFTAKCTVNIKRLTNASL